MGNGHTVTTAIEDPKHLGIFLLYMTCQYSIPFIKG